MSPSKSKIKLENILSQCSIVVAYDPLSQDIDYTQAPLPKNIFEQVLLLPKDKKSDPYRSALNCKEKFGKRLTCILIPGKEFDKYGTRHGRGFGWYDRFLSEVPSTWIRIGITDISKFSLKLLQKMPWDEPVDWILVYDSSTSSWETYETLARLQ